MVNGLCALGNLSPGPFLGHGTHERICAIAEFHLHGQIIKRSEGRSAVNAAAYRAGEALYDKRLGVLFDYTRKQEVEESIILGPDHAPDWMFDREVLWNTVEVAERHRAAQLSREFDIALPIELVEQDPAAAKEALKSWVRDMFVTEGLMADVNFHDMESQNPHAHIMTTMRRVDLQAMEFEEGSVYAFESTKARDQNDWGYMDFWRETWADYANAAMAARGIDARIDHRTLIEQGLDREPGIHIGPNVKAMDDRDIETDRATKNAIIWYRNEREWFEENDRYVAFLDAEAAEERRREEEQASKEEAERKELEIAAAIVAQADHFRDLAQRVGAAARRQVGKSEGDLVDLTALLDHYGKAPVAAGRATFDDVIKDFARVQVQFAADLTSRRETVAHIEVRLGNAARRVVNTKAKGLTTSFNELTEKFRDVLGDEAIRYFDLADRLAAKALELLAAGAVLPHESGGRAEDAARRISAEAPVGQGKGGNGLESPHPGFADSPPRLEPATAGLPAAQPDIVQNRKIPPYDVADRKEATWTSITDKLATAAGVAKAVGGAVAGDARLLAVSAASVLWRGARDASVRLVMLVEQAIGPAVHRAASVLRARDRSGAGRERRTEQGRSAGQTAIEVSPPDRDSPGNQHDEGRRRSLTLSLIELFRSSAERLRRVRQARKAEAEEKAAKAEKAALDRDLRLAERAIRAGVDDFAPEAERLFVEDWIRTLKATDGQMRVRYEEADLAALKDYALGMERRPQFGELDKVLVRLSPSAGGVQDSAKIPPDELPEGMKPDFRHAAIYTKHVRWVVGTVEADRDVADHFDRILRASVEAEQKFEMDRDIDPGRYTGRIVGQSGPEFGD